MKNFVTYYRYFLILPILLFVTACSDPDEEVMQDLDSQINLEAEQMKANNAAKAKMYTAELSPLNGSGVTGTAELTLMGDQLTVEIFATGVEPGNVHLQHIHGFMDNNKNSKCPPPSADGDDADDLVGFLEGRPFYGPVLLPLDPFPVPTDQTINFKETYTLSDDTKVTPLQNTSIVLHGMTVDGTYIETLPIACGQIRPAQGNNK